MMSAYGQITISDEELAIQVQQGRESAMAELYSRYYMLVFNKCMSFAKNTDDASDLAQDVMIKVIEKIKSFKGNSKFSTWLYSVTFNHCTDESRKTKRKYFETIANNFEIIDHSETELVEALEAEYMEDLAGQAISAIPEEDQQLLLMKYQFNKSIRDLQAMYNISASAVKMRLKRARSKVQIIYNSRLELAA